jgi:hypothetical protein
VSERYIKVSRLDAEVGGIEDAYDAAEGQRVEEIRWCETRAIPANDDSCFLGRNAHSCRIVEATLILSPKVEP